MMPSIPQSQIGIAPQRRRAFTVVELLVVITIILLLITLLLPTVKRANTAALMAVCASNQRQLGIGVITYASDNMTNYPYRKADMVAWVPRKSKLRAVNADGSTYSDDRPMLAKIFSINAMQCPFVRLEGINLETSMMANVHWSYDMYFGSMIDRTVPSSAMLRTSFDTTYQGHRIRVMAADMDWDYSAIGQVMSSHPDYMTNLLWLYDYGNGNATTHCLQAWVNFSYQRGPTDRNFLYRDGSVITMTGLTLGDPRLLRVPNESNFRATGWTGDDVYVPLE